MKTTTTLLTTIIFLIIITVTTIIILDQKDKEEPISLDRTSVERFSKSGLNPFGIFYGNSERERINELGATSRHIIAQKLWNWSRLIQKVYNSDPLICPKCAGNMRIISFIEDSAVIKMILKHLNLWETYNHDPPEGKIKRDYVPEEMPDNLTNPVNLHCFDYIQVFYDDDYSDPPFEDDYSQSYSHEDYAE